MTSKKRAMEAHNSADCPPPTSSASSSSSAAYPLAHFLDVAVSERTRVQLPPAEPHTSPLRTSTALTDNTFVSHNREPICSQDCTSSASSPTYVHSKSSSSPPSLRQRSCDSEDILITSSFQPSSPYRSACAEVNPASMSERAYPARSDSRFPPKNAVSAFPDSNEHRPLIDFVTNEWQKNISYRDGSFESDDSYPYYNSEKDLYAAPQLPDWLKRILNIKVPRRVQRYLGGYIIFLLALWFGWLYWLQPAWAHEKLLDDAALRATTKGQVFGVNMRPSFSDMIQIQELDPRYLPSATNVNKRLVFVGDVHGCKSELMQLLDKVGFNPSNDHLIFTGDLIAKGPDSSGAVDLAMELGASCVRGNWEDRTLLAYNTLTSKQHPLPGPAEDPRTKEDYLDEESFSHGDYKDRALAKLLTKEQIKWLKACPVILKVGRISGFNKGSEIVVAHAGLVPGIALERQDPFQAMNMRSIDLNTRVPSAERKGEPWEKLWNHHQIHLKDVSQRATIIYGHDAKRGLNIQKYSKGLDSACLKGGSLTAMILDSSGRQKIVSVDCKRYRD
ncbi:uncharacterized protein PV09_07836 [Verruconis gallopava]|uniref:Calcineurin-like phosphoesterase domain-containing protein n=1 Tax=Verruconis gallopava TaxID=253628 RepID=A0A0D2A1P3_9PEZI|nr:uncharacterized protein PV09_07836 [Verruconis gallopava]KIW00643.1 hypothetical protein PV09_07836 [Verruconis gallopava]